MAAIFTKLFHGGMKVSMYFLPWKTPTLITGTSATVKLVDTMKNNGSMKPFIAAGPNIYKRGLLNPMLKAMDDSGIVYTLFTDITPNPTDTCVEKGLKLMNENKCDSMVIFGGGSPMDCGKAIACLYANPGKSVSQLQGLLKVRHKLPPVYAVPTTSGTGSETTIAAVITEQKTHHKASINDPHLMPKYAVLEPELTAGLPPKTTAETGMDALCHAVECYTNGTYNTKLENDYAKKAVKLIFDNLYSAYEIGSNIEARQNMQLAAFYAGRAFTRGCVGYVHAVGHTLSGLYGISHGQAMAVILPHVMRQFGKSAEGKLSQLAEICGLEPHGDSFIDWIETVNEKMGIPKGFDCIKDEDIPQMIDWAMAEGNPVYPTPATWNREDFRTLIQSIRL